MRIWVVGTLIGLIIQLPVYGFLHIDWKKIELYLPALLLLLLGFLITVAAIHVGLKVYKVPSAFPDTLALYSVIVGSYSPLIIVLALPGLIELLTTLQAAKSAGVSDIESVVQRIARSMADAGSKSTTMQIFQAIAAPVLFGISMTLIVVFQRRISELYKSETFRTVSAISFSMGVLVPVPMVLVTGLYYFTFYAAL